MTEIGSQDLLDKHRKLRDAFLTADTELERLLSEDAETRDKSSSARLARTWCLTLVTYQEYVANREALTRRLLHAPHDTA